MYFTKHRVRQIPVFYIIGDNMDSRSIEVNELKVIVLECAVKNDTSLKWCQITAMYR